MSDLEIDPAVGRLVDAWLDKHDPDSDENEQIPEVLDFTPRPARLGLGAKYVPHRPSMSDADRRLAGALKKQKLDAQRDRPEVVIDAEEVDSRAKVVTPKKRGRGRPRKFPLAPTPNPVVSCPTTQVGTLTPATHGDEDFGRPEHSAGVANGAAHNGHEDDASSDRFQKRKKIRSRQKNLKRDNRPKDQLPAHLTEETLYGGRVRKEDVPNVYSERSD